MGGRFALILGLSLICAVTGPSSWSARPKTVALTFDGGPINNTVL
jgi:peptidoglycan/xylan/chitin deacetylase (PgdA/CDA1 family)